VKNALVIAACLALVLLSPLVPTPDAAAHDPIARTEPAAGAVLEGTPSAVEVWLIEPLSTQDGAEVRVVHNQSGQRVDAGGTAQDPSDPAHLSVQLRPDLGPGKYVVSWAVVSGGHEETGSFSFAVADQAREENDDLVPIALGTFGAAAGMIVVGTLGYLLRARLGLVKPPPEEGRGSR